MTQMTTKVPVRLLLAAGLYVILGIPYPAVAQTVTGGNSIPRLGAIHRIAPTDAVALAAEPPSVSVTTDAGWGDAAALGIDGTVRDATGAPLTGAVLTIKSLTTDQTVHSTSDSSGAFSVGDLAPGSYEVTATRSGFHEADATVVLAASGRVHANFRLTPSTSENAASAAGAGAVDLSTLQARLEQLETELSALKAKPVLGSAPPGAPGQTQDAAAQAAPPVDEKTPFAYADFTWLNGSPRNKKVAFDSPFFTPEVRFDTHFMQSFNHPIDHTLVGSTESFRSGEFQEEQISVGGDFHMDNVRGRVLYMMGLFATTTPRNDASPGVGQWQLDNAYRYTSEAYGGYHFDVQHGINIDAGIFVSYIGLFSYYNFDNWTYQPSYVSSNTPWFFNGLRIQWFPTNKLKIEPWLINGWQSYGRPNGRMGFGGQVLWQPHEWLKVVFNNYTNGADAVGIPDRRRFHTDDSIEIRYYNKPESTGLSKIAMSFTADYGCEWGGGVTCHGGDAATPSQYFAGWMVYNRFWFNKDKFAITPGGGVMTNPGRYLTLLPPINGATAFTGTPYFTASPGDQAHQWDMTLNFQYMPKDFITFWGEVGYRHSDVPYFAGAGGVTPPGGNNGSPASFACITGASAGTNNLAAAQTACGGPSNVWFPDLRKTQTVLSMGILVKF
jgi:hypothetical protein